MFFSQIFEKAASYGFFIASLKEILSTENNHF